MEKRMKISSSLLSVLCILLGVVLVAFPDTTMRTVCYIFAGCLLLVGLYYVIAYFRKDLMEAYYQYDLVIGMVVLVIGICIILKVDAVITMIPMLMGIIVFANGIVKLQHAIDLKRAQFSGWVYVLVFALLCIAISIVLLLEPKSMAEIFTRLVGIGFIFGGVTDMITLFFLTKQIKVLRRAKEEAEAVDVEATEEAAEENEAQEEVSQGGDEI